MMTISRRQFIAGTSSLLALGNNISAQNLLKEKMITRPIPASGEQLPIIGLGTLQAFDVTEVTSERAGPSQVLNALVDHGGTLVDTSPRYGRAEARLGELATKLNLTDSLFFATKVFSEGKQAGVDEMNASFEALNLDQIDLMQVHSMRDWQNNLPSIYRLKEQGKVRYTGITIHRDSGHDLMMQLMRDEDIDFIQVNYNLLERNIENELLPLAQESDIAVMINVPFAKAELFILTANEELPDWAESFDCSSWAQFFLKYVVSHPAVTCVIPRTSKPHHMVDNLLAGFGRMPDQDTRMEMVKLIEGLSA
jgi:diketogulonate reductase-like aldo/keto reductase